ncbi:ninjurin C isoform X1 [Musca autumnalis]|uniref:ninjurin C isoform X1 n=1 Tax=Musca autumnalis TaxID=221902 RepID=UPI003CF4713F
MAQAIANALNNDTEMKSMDANRYATKKTIAQGMLDIALLTANASQLKYILQVGEQHQFYKLMLVLISLSIILQIAAGFLLMVVSVTNIHKGKTERAIADALNHVINGLIFLSLFCDIIKMNFGLDPAIPDNGKNLGVTEKN